MGSMSVEKKHPCPCLDWNPNTWPLGRQASVLATVLTWLPEVKIGGVGGINTETKIRDTMCELREITKDIRS